MTKRIDVVIDPKTGQIENAEWMEGAPGGNLCAEKLKELLAGLSNKGLDIKAKKDAQQVKNTQKVGG